MKYLGIAGGFVLAMVFTNGVNGQEERFVTESSLQSNLEKQLAMSPQTLSQLREYGVSSEANLKLEYFFFTNADSKAKALSESLRNKGYSVESGLSATDDSLFVVTGWSTPIVMGEHHVVLWTEEMTRLGYQFDCEFDGWGTNPEQ